jgi:hypothetical protein
MLIERKTDHILSYSERDLATSKLYDETARKELRDRLGLATDSFTESTTPFSRVEVKPSDGGHAQAELQ